MRYRELRFSILVMVFLLVTTVGSGWAEEFKVVVEAGTKAFTPQEVRVKPGDEVIWVNESDEDHFLTSSGPSSKPPVTGTENLLIHKLLLPGESATHVFEEPEHYNFFCAIHTEMWGTVIVEK